MRITRTMVVLLLAHAGNGAFAADGYAPPVPPRPLGAAPAGPATDAGANTFVLPPVTGIEVAPAGAAIAGFRFEGNTVFSSEELQQAVSAYVGRPLGAAALEEVRNLLTLHYVNAGYINSGALIDAPPPGGYPDNVIPINIVEGHVDGFIIKGAGRLKDSYIEKRLVHDGEVLNVNTIRDRFSLLLSDPLFVKINSRIVPGAARGKALLDLDVVRARPYALSVFTNNYLPPSTGAQAVGLSGMLRNLSGYGDVLDATVQHTSGTDPVHLGWSVPLGAGVLGLHASYDRATSSVVEEPLKQIDIRSLTSGYEIGVSDALIDTLPRRVELGLSYGEHKSNTTLLGVPFSFTPGEVNGYSNSRLLHFSQEWTERWERRALTARSVFSWGSNNADPTGAAVLVPSRNFHIWTGQCQFVQKVFDNGAQVLLRGVTQLSGDRLLPLDRIALGGVATVRGYRENTLVRDQGYAASAEFSYPLWQGDGDKHSLALVAFLDGGDGWNRGESHQRLTSAGLGLNWRLGRLAADLYLAHRMTRLPVDTSGNLQDRGIHFQLSYGFF